MFTLKLAFSLHDADFAQTLWFAEKFFSRPPTVIFAIQPGDISGGMQLSEHLTAKLPDLQKVLLRAIEHWSVSRRRWHSEHAAGVQPDLMLAKMLICDLKHPA